MPGIRFVCKILRKYARYRYKWQSEQWVICSNKKCSVKSQHDSWSFLHYKTNRTCFQLTSPLFVRTPSLSLIPLPSPLSSPFHVVCNLVSLKITPSLYLYWERVRFPIFVNCPSTLLLFSCCYLLLTAGMWDRGGGQPSQAWPLPPPPPPPPPYPHQCFVSDFSSNLNSISQYNSQYYHYIFWSFLCPRPAVVSTKEVYSAALLLLYFWILSTREWSARYWCVLFMTETRYQQLIR